MTTRTHQLTLSLLTLLLSMASLAAEDEGQDKPARPAEQYQALLKEYQKAASGGAASDEERKKVIARVDKLRDNLALRFLELAEKNPTDPIAVDVLLGVVRAFRCRFFGEYKQKCRTNQELWQAPSFRRRNRHLREFSMFFARLSQKPTPESDPSPQRGEGRKGRHPPTLDARSGHSSTLLLAESPSPCRA